MFNTAVGAFAWNRLIPFQKEASGSYPLFRKAWLRHSVGMTGFAAGYWLAGQFQTRIIPKFSYKHYKNATGGVDGTQFLNNQDLVSKFRFFENSTAYADAESEVRNYVDLYTTGPLTKASLLDRIAEGESIDPEFAKKF